MTILNTPKEVAAYVNECFTSAEVNRILFGYEEMEPRDARDFSVLYRMLLLSHVSIYAKWLQRGRECYAYTNGRHARNVFELFNKIYKVQRLDLDVVIYTLTEGRRDAMEFGEKSFFYEFFDLSGECKYSRAYDILRVALETGTFKPQEVIEHIRGAVVDLKVLHAMRIRVDAEERLKNVTLEFGGQSYALQDVFVYYQGAFCVLKDRNALNDCMERNYHSLETLDEVMHISKLNIGLEEE